MTTPRVRDYTPDRTIAVDVADGPAFELLLSLFVLGTWEDDEPYDVGQAWVDEVRDRAGADLLDDLARFGGCGEVWLGLLGVAHDIGAPRSLDALVAAIEQHDPVAMRDRLIGISLHGAEVDPEVRSGAARGAAGALDALLEERKFDAGLVEILRLAPAASVDLIASVVRRFAEEAFVAVDSEAIAREAASRRSLVGSVDPEKLVETATNGITFEISPEVSEVVLVPSVVVRPWTTITAENGRRFFCYAVPDAAMEPDGGQPPPQLVEVYKALGDERRMQILAALAEGPLRLTELTERVDLAKSTIHHHLRTLRTAGLVRIVVGEDKVYALREGAVMEAGSMLEAFLKTRKDN
jgi:DNA-binding transcriptional ArsR family regulator